jgi:hydrogenase maturation protease
VEVLVIGLGNRDRGDDAIGLAAVEALRPKLPLGVRTALHEGEPTALVDLWSGLDAVVLIDATSSGSPPGTVHRFEATQAPLPARHLGRSSHALRPATAIELGRALGRLPRQLLVYGMEGESYDLGAALSTEVVAALPTLVRRVLGDIDRLAEGGAGPARGRVRA